jgi:hypothetical protein
MRPAVMTGMSPPGMAASEKQPGSSRSLAESSGIAARIGSPMRD